MTSFVEEGIRYDFGLFTYTKRKDGIIRSELNRKITYDLKQAYLGMKFKLSIEPHFKQRILVKMNPDITVTHEAMRYLMSEEYNEFTQCLVHFGQTPDEISNPKYLKADYSTPIGVFDQEEDAIAWLNSFAPQSLTDAKVDGYIRELETRIEALDYVIR